MGAFSPFSSGGSSSDDPFASPKKPAAKVVTTGPATPSSFSYKMSEEQFRKLRGILEERGWEFKPVPYTEWGATKDKLTVNAYTSGKLLVQGKGAGEFVEFILEPEILGEAKLGYAELHNPQMYEPHLGIDESGKGDFFGPLVIAGVYTKKSTARKLLEMGVRDSKTIGSDPKAEALADEIKDVVGPNGWKVISMGPEKYNELYGKFRNLNRLLAWGHATVIESLLEAVPDCPRALSDQFADPTLIQKALKDRGKGIIMEQRTKAESDIAVAAASILARAEFIRRLRMLGEGAGTVLPKGASAMTKATAKRIATEKGPESLRKLCKAHFKTYYEATGIVDPTMRPGALEDAKKPQSFWADKRNAYKNKAATVAPAMPGAPAAAAGRATPALAVPVVAKPPARARPAPVASAVPVAVPSVAPVTSGTSGAASVAQGTGAAAASGSASATPVSKQKKTAVRKAPAIGSEVPAAPAKKVAAKDKAPGPAKARSLKKKAEGTGELNFGG